jgi:hypothetical protein
MPSSASGGLLGVRLAGNGSRPTAWPAAFEARSYRHVDSNLKHGLDRFATREASPPLSTRRLPPGRRGGFSAIPTTSIRVAKSIDGSIASFP